MRLLNTLQAQLEQGLHAAEAAEQGQDHSLLLRQPSGRQDTEAQVRRVWVRLQEGGVLDNNIPFKKCAVFS